MASSKSRAAIAGLGLVLVLFGAAIAQEKYLDKYDFKDVEIILNNEEEREKYYNCFMDTGPCPNEGAEYFKSKAPEALVTSCRYCTDTQLIMFEKIVSWYVEHKPKEWNDLIEKVVNDAKKMGLMRRR
ncbi:hypothetical protein QAD02_001671 [Eretmocerus hayati]|uniref:Uncharacterized protein n=1 Tax=Eretmocerus hayati TaxID=131215 RepID=A0ACC2NH36_9HYME|nr:hypothetical protein QAD02_001671 [Eretmocerus hayati]